MCPSRGKPELTSLETLNSTVELGIANMAFVGRNLTRANQFSPKTATKVLGTPWDSAS